MRISSILALLSCASMAVAEEPSANPIAVANTVKPADSARRTEVIRLKNVLVTEAAKAVNDELERVFDVRADHEGFVVKSPVVLVPEVETNSLIVSAKPIYMEKIKSLVGKLDEAQPSVIIQMMIQEVENGKVTTLSRPQVRTTNGTKTVIEVGSTDKSLRITVTPRIVQPESNRRR